MLFRIWNSTDSLFHIKQVAEIYRQLTEINEAEIT